MAIVQWIEPQLVTYKARDGVDVYARLFTPEMVGARRDPAAPAVVFVHGAGYLQNAHKYWSSYYHEYMFHNLLAAHGYVVLDPDYRASAGYGRDWRTAPVAPSVLRRGACAPEDVQLPFSVVGGRVLLVDAVDLAVDRVQLRP